SPAARHWATVAANSSSASPARPRIHSAMLRYPRACEASIHSPSPASAKAREENAAACSASPRSSARYARPSATRPRTLTSRLAARRPEWLIRYTGGPRVGALGGIEQPLSPLHLAAEQGQP